jgi:hypothetical protein
MISNIGYFHFGVRHQDPIGSLTATLTKFSEIVLGSLIVLPELVDIRTSYYCHKQWKDYDATFASHLVNLAGRFSVIFVAGLRVPNSNGGRKCYNASVLVTANEATILHLKNECDMPQHCDAYEGLLQTNPMTIENILLGSIICADVNRPICYRDSLDPRETIFGKFDKIDRQNQWPRVVCIPSFMRKNFFSIDSGHLYEKKWRGHYVVVANSRSDSIGHESFIALPNGDIVKSSIGKKNEISTHPILKVDWHS